MIPQPRVVGPLTIEQKLSSDGVVETFKGSWRTEGKSPVIVRRLQDWLTHDEVLMSAVEARVNDLRALRHPRLVRVFESFSFGDERFIIEESVTGMDLLTLVDDVRRLGGSLPPNIFLHFAVQLCTNLVALHNSRGASTGEQPLLHRALRPAAVTIALDGSVRLGSYGLLPSPNLVPPRMFRGPVAARTAFLAPEQVDDGRPTTRATDIFSLGAVLYTMLTGEVLFDAPSDLQAIWLIREGGIQDRLAATRTILPGIERVLTRALQPEAVKRYPNAEQVCDDLRTLVDVYDSSHINDEVLDLLAAIGLDPPARATSRAPVARPIAPDVDDDLEEPTAHSGKAVLSADALLLGAPSDLLDEHTESSRTQSVEVPAAPAAAVQDAFSAALLGMADPTRRATINLRRPAPPYDGAGADDTYTSLPSTAGLPDSDLDEVHGSERTAQSIVPPAREVTEPLPSWALHVDDPPTLPELPPYPADRGAVPLGRFAAVAVVTVLAAFSGGILVSSALLGPPAQQPVVTAAVQPAPVAPPVAPPVEVAPTPPAATPPAPPVVAPPAPTAWPTVGAKPREVGLVDPARPQPPAVAPTPSPAVAVVAPAPTPGKPAAEVAEWSPPPRLTDADGLGARAAAGKLTPADRERLEGVAVDHPDFSRARVWLYDDASARGVLSERKRHIDALMRAPENHYNPVFLTEAAEVALATKDYAAALSMARKAEQHWARLPSEAVFHRKAMIYEEQALAWYGLHIASDATDVDALHQSMRAWQRYRQHVATRDPSLTQRADDQLARLADIQARLE